MQNNANFFVKELSKSFETKQIAFTKKNCITKQIICPLKQL